MELQGNEIQIKKMTLGSYDTNCYIVICPGARESMIIDAPAEAASIAAEAGGTRVKYIVITHGHGDHTLALEELRSRIKAPVAAHPLDAAGINPDLNLNDGDILMVGSVAVTVLHTPGHTPGSICLLAGKHLLGGDTLFPGGPGHTSSPDDFVQIVDSIKRKILVLPDDIRIHPGHGADTVLGGEKREIALFSSRSHAPGLCGDVLWLNS